MMEDSHATVQLARISVQLQSKTDHFSRVLLAPLLTASWIFSNLKSHAYARPWWKVLQEIENRGEWVRKPDYVSNCDVSPAVSFGASSRVKWDPRLFLRLKK